MKFAAKSLLFLMSLAATFTYAQTLPPGTFKHIIIVVQENRTPDNLFGSGSSGTKCGIEVPFEPGVDIENGGNVTGKQQPQCLIPLPLSSWDATLNGGQIVDPGHYYADWGIDYDKGSMDGFCHKFGNTCPEYSYVPKSDVQPYFDIATNYGFANYFFQTNQGPSYPAHQFLFTGTSAPVAPKKNYYLDFVGGTNPSNFNESGCANNNNDIPSWVLPDGTQDFTPPISVECYPHDSLVTNSGGDKIVSWAYYTVPPRNIIWDAPAAIPEVCYGENDLDDVGQACGPQGEKF
jgi:phospholipase C